MPLKHSQSIYRYTRYDKCPEPAAQEWMVGHNCWTRTYAQKEFWTFLFKHSKKAPGTSVRAPSTIVTATKCTNPVSTPGISSMKSDLTAVTQKVYLDIEVKDQPTVGGRVVVGLYGNCVPKTTENFRCFCTGEKGTTGGTSGLPLHYKGALMHRVIKGFMLQGGDISFGRGGDSIYGGRWADENFYLKHTEAGLLSMANKGPDTQSCQFFLTTVPTPWLDGKHVVFGKVTDGMEVVQRLEAVETGLGDRPTSDIIITDCGEID